MIMSYILSGFVGGLAAGPAVGGTTRAAKNVS